MGGLVSSEQSSSTTAGCLLACQLVHKERTINRPPLGQQSNRIIVDQYKAAPCDVDGCGREWVLEYWWNWMRAVISRMCAPTQRQWTVEFKGGRLQFNNHKNYHNINRGSVDSLSIQLIN